MSIPWEIILDILVRLPLKPIVRFRCVNKLWYKTLKSPKFLKARNEYAVEMGKFNLMFHNAKDSVSTFSYDASLCTGEGTSYKVYFGESYKEELEVLGYCNGLVLLKHVSRYYLSSVSHVLMLWNPTTNEYKTLPNPPIGTKGQGKSYVEYGFGYAEKIKDFKVVHLTKASTDGLCDVHVYTLKKKSWRRLDNVEIDDLYYPKLPDMGRCPVDGGFHWIVKLEQSEFLHDIFILRFEFETDEIDTVALPDFDEDQQVNLCVLGGSLCCFYSDTEVISVWELKDDDDNEEESWTILFTIDLEKHFGAVFSFMPLQFLKNGKIVLGLLLSDGCLHIIQYDPKLVTFKTITVHDQSAEACPHSGNI